MSPRKPKPRARKNRERRRESLWGLEPNRYPVFDAAHLGLGLMSLLLGIGFTSAKHIFVGNEISPMVGWCETLGHLPTPDRGFVSWGIPKMDGLFHGKPDCKWMITLFENDFLFCFPNISHSLQDLFQESLFQHGRTNRVWELQLTGAMASSKAGECHGGTRFLFLWVTNYK